LPSPARPKQGDKQDYQSAGDDQGEHELQKQRDAYHFRT
jgi:hypothetical protein